MDIYILQFSCIHQGSGSWKGPKQARVQGLEVGGFQVVIRYMHRTCNQGSGSWICATCMFASMIHESWTKHYQYMHHGYTMEILHHKYICVGDSLIARRTWKTKSSRPDGPKLVGVRGAGLVVRAGGLEVGAQRAPRHLVHYKSGAYIFMIIKIFPFVNSSVLSFPLTILWQ